MTGTNDIDGRTADAQAVAQLVLRERQSRDRGWWDAMASCFTPDAVIDMSWFNGPASEFVRLTRERSANGVWGRHRLSPPTVRVIGDRAWAELPLGIEFRAAVNGVEADLVSYARSQYRAERRDGAWRIARITSIYERDTLTPGRHSASIPRTSPRSGPPTAAWPGTSTKRAPRWAATCWATTAQTESHTTTRPSALGSWHA
jgi:SnoaL-like protein